MKKEDLVNLGLDETQIGEIFKMRGIEIEANKQAIETLKQEKDNIEQAKQALEGQLEEIKNTELTPETVEALKNEKLQLEEQIASMEKAHADELTGVQYNMLLETGLKDAGARDINLVKSILGEDVVKFEDGKLVGLDEALTSAKTTHGYLFTEADSGKPKFTDKSTGTGAEQTVNAFSATFGKFSGK